MPEKLSHGPRANSDLNRCAGLSRGPNLQKKLTAAAWSNTFPAPGATLDLDFANDHGFVRGVGQGGAMDAVTFTRASSGNWVDSTGTLRTGAGSFTGTANALGKNLLTFPQDFENAAWSKQNIAVTSNAIVAPDGTATADALIPANGTNPYSGIYRSETTVTPKTLSAYVCKGSKRWVYLLGYNGTNNCWFDLENGVVGTRGANYSSSSIENIGNGWYRISAVLNTSLGIYTNVGVYCSDIDNSQVCTGDGSTVGLYTWGAQLEVGSSATTYYPTNINVPRFDWASTERTGAGTAPNPYVIPLQANPTCNGLLIEESRANRLLWCRDATQTNWTKTNITATKTQTGIDGVSNAASSLTASADGGTCIQTITLASGSRTGSVYLKRLTGTGDIQVTLDGSTWSTVDLSNGLWNRIVLSGTVTNPCVGIKIAINGDAVAMDYGQIEDNSGTYVGVTSPILTTTASVTRSADVANMIGTNFSGWYQPDKGTINVDAAYSGSGYVASISDNSIQNRILTGYNVVITAGGAAQVGISLSGAPTKTVCAYTVNYAELLSGSLSTIDTSVILPLVNRMYIGTSATGNNNFINGTIKRITYFPKVLTKNAMQNLNGDAT